MSSHMHCSEWFVFHKTAQSGFLVACLSQERHLCAGKIQCLYRKLSPTELELWSILFQYCLLTGSALSRVPDRSLA